MIKENLGPMMGFIEVKFIDLSGTVIKKSVLNLIVTKARESIRNMLITGDAGYSISKIQLGDMNMSYGDDTSNLPPPTLSNVSLQNPIITKTNYAIIPSIIEGRNALEASFLINANEANDSNPAINFKLITELGLYTVNDSLFSRVVTPIIKTRDIALDITWKILI